MPPTPGAPSTTPHASNSLLLSRGIGRLEVTLKLTTAIRALAAGVYTYLGVRELLDGNPTTEFFCRGDLFRCGIRRHLLRVRRTPIRDEMSVAQNISASCRRHLREIGIDLQVWMHAIETPHDGLFIFKADELKALNLVTAAPDTTPASATRKLRPKGGRNIHRRPLRSQRRQGTRPALPRYLASSEG